MATIYEEVKVQAKDLVDKVQDFIHEGNVRRIILKDERGHTFLEIPLTIAAIGVVAAPVLAAVGGIAALVANFTLVIERNEPHVSATSHPASPPSGDHPSGL